jgi:hypothetical protein
MRLHVDMYGVDQACMLALLCPTPQIVLATQQWPLHSVMVLATTRLHARASAGGVVQLSKFTGAVADANHTPVLSLSPTHGNCWSPREDQWL